MNSMATETRALSTLASYLKRGDTFDPEDHRTTHRLRVARGLLAEVGVEPIVEHGELCAKHPSNLGCGMRDPGGCWNTCKTIWAPDWVTDEMFEMAARAADSIQSLRGAASQAQMNRARSS